jgi:uncharacterized protein (TIGR03437 family)
MSVRIGGLDAEVFYAGAASGQVAGVLQVNARVLADVTPVNFVPVLLTIGAFQSHPGITLAIQ